MVLVLKKGASEEEMQLIKEKLRKRSNKSGIDTKKYSGTIHLKEDPMAIQNRMRGE